MAVLSVDLACRRWSDIGIVLLERAPINPSKLASAPFGRDPAVVSCEVISWNGAALDAAEQEAGVQADILAGRLNHLCNIRGVRTLMLDGPQAWKSRTNGLLHSRSSERQVNAVAKTGLPGMVKPASGRTYAEFCIDVYDALTRRGWRRLATREQPSPGADRILVESCPYAAWKSLGLRPLPTKRRARVSDLARSFAALNSIVPLCVSRPPNHDQLQAIVAGLAGLAFEARDAQGARIVGQAPRREDGQWREGFIALPVAPHTFAERQWLV